MRAIRRVAVIAAAVIIAVGLCGAIATPRADAASVAKQIKALQKAVKKLQPTSPRSSLPERRCWRSRPMSRSRRTRSTA